MAPLTRRSQRLTHASGKSPRASAATIDARKVTKANLSKASSSLNSTSNAEHLVSSQTSAGHTAPELLLPDVASWRTWLDHNESTSNGVWLVLSKGGSKVPTSLTNAQALDEALCSGWINGQGRSRDSTTCFARYTPRRPKSSWSAINVGHIERLRDQGRMRPRGDEEVNKAIADGRWQRAYPGSKDMKVPEELFTLLENDPKARTIVEGFSSAQRYSAMLPVAQATTDALRMKRIKALAKRLIEQAEHEAV